MSRHRLTSWLLNGLTVLSLLACVGSAVLWVRGQWWDDRFWWRPMRHVGVSLVSREGWLRFAVIHHQSELPVGLGIKTIRSVWDAIDFCVQYDSSQVILSAGGGQEEWAGVQVVPFAAAATVPIEQRLPAEGGYAYVYVPPWALCTLAAILPAGRVFAWRRRRRRAVRAGHRAACGYDLRATPERCPECGATVAAVSVNGR